MEHKYKSQDELDLEEEQKEELEKEVKDQKILDVVRAYKAVFSGEGGTRVLKDMEGTCFYNRTSFSSDPALNAFQEGRRSVILDIMNILGKDEEEVLGLVNKTK